MRKALLRKGFALALLAVFALVVGATGCCRKFNDECKMYMEQSKSAADRAAVAATSAENAAQAAKQPIARAQAAANRAETAAMRAERAAEEVCAAMASIRPCPPVKRKRPAKRRTKRRVVCP
jgi:inorganic triphosphatase YgiF